MTIKQAVILAGGFGTRMREEAEFKPKPMVQVGGKPIIEHIIRSFVNQGVEKVVVLLGYKGEVIREHFLNYKEYSLPVSVNLRTGEKRFWAEPTFPDCEVFFVETGGNSLTGERLLRATEYLDEAFYLTYGDGLADVNLASLEKTHREAKNLVTVTVTPNPSKFGVIKRDQQGQIYAFSEKPEGHDLINMGYFVIEKESLNLLPHNTMLESDFMQNLISKDKLGSYRHDGYFAAIDTPRDLENVNKQYSEGLLQWLN